MSQSGTDDQRIGWLRRAIYAHRGWHDETRMENSPAAFRAAIAAGYGIECDVQLTADDEAVVFHDFDLDRLTSAQGPVRGQTLSMLEAIPLLNGQPIWTLARLLEEVRGQVPLLVEIKSRHGNPIERLCRAVARALTDYEGDIAIMSFDPIAVRWFSANAPQVIRGLVVTEEGNPGAFARARAILARRFARAQFIAHDVRDLPSPFVQNMRDAGLPVLTWTVNSLELRERASLHADAPIAEGAGLP